MDVRSPIDSRRTFRSVPPRGNPYRKPLITRSDTEAHRRNTQCRESFRRTDIHMGERARSIEEARFEGYRRGANHTGSGSSPDRARRLTVEIRSAASRFGERISAWTCVLRSIADARFEAYRQGAIHTGSSSSRARARMLTVEIHSASSRFCRQISARARASSLLAALRPGLAGTPLRTASAIERQHSDGPRADRWLMLTIELHSAPSRWRTRIGASKSAHRQPRASAHR